MKIRGFEIVKNEARKHLDKEIQLPKRGSSSSAGYDFYTPKSFTIKPNEKVVVWTDIKAYMQENEVLKLYVRSSIGIKKGLMLANGTGIIDKDYYSNMSNDGNVGICLLNISENIVTIEENERIAQGIFMNFLSADTGNTSTERTGGIGSTNK